MFAVQPQLRLILLILHDQLARRSSGAIDLKRLVGEVVIEEILCAGESDEALQSGSGPAQPRQHGQRLHDVGLARVRFGIEQVDATAVQRQLPY